MNPTIAKLNVAFINEIPALHSGKQQRWIKDMLLDCFQSEDTILYMFNDQLSLPQNEADLATFLDMLNELAISHNKHVLVELNKQEHSMELMRFLDSIINQNSVIAISEQDLQANIQQANTVKFYHCSADSFSDLLSQVAICSAKATSTLGIIRAKSSFSMSSYNAISQQLRQHSDTDYFAVGIVFDDSIVDEFELDLLIFEQTSHTSYSQLITRGKAMKIDYQLKDIAEQLADRGAYPNLQLNTVAQLLKFVSQQAYRQGMNEEQWDLEPQQAEFVQKELDDIDLNTYYDKYHAFLEWVSQFAALWDGRLRLM